jgi:hypothetical protein
MNMRKVFNSFAGKLSLIISLAPLLIGAEFNPITIEVQLK